MSKVFLKAEWRKLAMANYAIDPDLLRTFIPHRTELDLWNNNCYVSLVGFMFLNTRMRGIQIPFHVDFREVNLRFYVRHKSGNEWRRGVVFIKEIVQKPALAIVAKMLYGEPYVTLPMKHSWNEEEKNLHVQYQWKKKGKWNSFGVTADKALQTIAAGSEEEFITEHYWGYTKRGENKTSEYGVEHPRWEVNPVKTYDIDVDFRKMYGEKFASLSTMKPTSVFLA